jgi:hypothetical protein
MENHVPIAPGIHTTSMLSLNAFMGFSSGIDIALKKEGIRPPGETIPFRQGRFEWIF